MKKNIFLASVAPVLAALVCVTGCPANTDDPDAGGTKTYAIGGVITTNDPEVNVKFALVRLFQGEEQQGDTVRPGEDGRYTFTGVAAGDNYTITIKLSRFDEYTSEPFSVNGDRGDLNYSLTASPPVIAGAAIYANTANILTLEFNQNVEMSNANGFSFTTEAGKERLIPAGLSGNGPSRLIMLNRTVGDEKIWLSYDKDQGTVTAKGRPMESITKLEVSVLTNTDAPVVTTVYIPAGEPGTLVITFNKSMNASSVMKALADGSFVIKGDAVFTFAEIGTTAVSFTLTLDHEAYPGEQITLAYDAAQTEVADESGRKLAGFTRSVNNLL